METINLRPKHGIVLVLLLAIGVVVFAEQSCYGRELVREKPRIIGRLPTKMISVIEMNKSILKAEALQRNLEKKGIYKGDTVPEALTELRNVIEALKAEAAAIERKIEELNNRKEEMSGEVERLEGEKTTLVTERDKLEGEKVTLEADVDSLEKAKATIKAWFGGGMFSSIIGIILLVLKITSQKKDIKLKQIQIDKIAKKKD